MLTFPNVEVSCRRGCHVSGSWIRHLCNVFCPQGVSFLLLEAGLWDKDLRASNLSGKWSQETFMTEWESEAGKVRQLIYNVSSSCFRLGAIEALGNPGRSVNSVLLSVSPGTARELGHLPTCSWQWVVRAASFNSLALLVCHPHEQNRSQGLEKVRRERHAGAWHLEIRLTGKGQGARDGVLKMSATVSKLGKPERTLLLF